MNRNEVERIIELVIEKITMQPTSVMMTDTCVSVNINGKSYLCAINEKENDNV